jgi:hypothetical protein
VAVIGVMFIAHLLEMLIYGLALRDLDGRPGFGELSGLEDGSLAEYFYFSVVTYTSLGYGDMVATGDLRILAGFEALNGILMIAWTGSFTFLIMHRLWSIRLSSDEDEPPQSND